MLATIRKYHQIKNIEVVGLDYIQLMVERGDESTHELGRLSRHIKLLSGELGITTIVLSQLNREVDKRDDHRPLMSDLRQSGNLEEDADYMVALYREEAYVTNSPKAGTIEYIIRKARNGPIGSYDLRYDASTVTIYDESDLPGLMLN
jgi:replicative DNA helicase